MKIREVVNALKTEGVIAPLFGIPCLLSTRKDLIIRLTGNAHRLIQDPTQLSHPALDAQLIVRLLSLPVVVILNEEGSGWAVAPPGWPKQVVSQIGETVWFGIPDEDIENLIATSGVRIKVIEMKEGQAGAGPAVIDLRFTPPLLLRKGTPGILNLEQILGTNLHLAPGIILSILTVCTGNSCRSPLAAALLARACAGLPVTVGSAGIAAPVGNPATEFAIAVGKELGVDISNHRARQLDRPAIESSDMILVMENGHREWIVSHLPSAREKVRLLGGYPDREIEIPDPIGHSLEFYRSTALLIKAGALKVATDIKNRLNEKK